MLFCCSSCWELKCALHGSFSFSRDHRWVLDISIIIADLVYLWRCIVFFCAIQATTLRRLADVYGEPIWLATLALARAAEAAAPVLAELFQPDWVEQVPRALIFAVNEWAFESR